MKNMVGIVYHKALLPHRTANSLKEGGDAYPYESRIKKVIDKILERKIKHEENRRFLLAGCDRYLYAAFIWEYCRQAKTLPQWT